MSDRRYTPVRRVLAVASLAAFFLVALVDVGSASNVAAGLSVESDPSVPTWLYLLTGGAAIGASGLLSMFVTDRALITTIHEWSRIVPARESLVRIVRYAGGIVGVVALALVVYVGFTGPEFANANLAVLLVFVGGRAALTMVAYLVGNPWPLVNPWRFVAERLPHGIRSYPDRLGTWPAVAGLLALIWIEVVLSVTRVPSVLAAAVVAYSLYTLAGAVVFSPGPWFRRADPLSMWFRCYGAVAPLQRTGSGVAFRLPGAHLRDSDVLSDLSDVAFVVLLVWELTYSGFIVTPPGASVVEFVVGLGVPPTLTYLLLLIVGYGAFLGIYWHAARRSRRRAETYLTARYLAFRFAPPLLAIAAGYHLAHYAGFFLSLAPSLAMVAQSPLNPPANPLVLVLPSWIGIVDALFVLLGHVFAIWAAHATSFGLFSGRLQAIRSQYPFILVMIVFTMLSLWLISMPTTAPPFVEVGA